MLDFQRKITGILLFLSPVLLYCVAGQDTTPTVSDDMSETTPASMMTTEEDDDKLKFSQLLALIVLSTVLGFLLLAVFACGCYVCMKMKDAKKNRAGQDLVYEGHYSSKTRNNGQRTKVVAVKADVYSQKKEPFWGVQHAVAESLDRQNGYDNSGFNQSPYGGQAGYSPVGSNQRYFR